MNLYRSEGGLIVILTQRAFIMLFDVRCPTPASSLREAEPTVIDIPYGGPAACLQAHEQ